MFFILAGIRIPNRPSPSLVAITTVSPLTSEEDLTALAYVLTLRN